MYIASHAGAQQTLPGVFPYVLLGGLPRGAGTARHCLPTLDEKRGTQPFFDGAKNSYLA